MDAAEQVLRAAIRVELRTVLRLIDADPHQWSTRPCATCRAVSSATLTLTTRRSASVGGARNETTHREVRRGVRGVQRRSPEGIVDHVRKADRRFLRRLRTDGPRRDPRVPPAPRRPKGRTVRRLGRRPRAPCGRTSTTERHANGA